MPGADRPDIRPGTRARRRSPINSITWQQAAAASIEHPSRYSNRNTVAGTVRFAKTSATAGIRPLLDADVAVTPLTPPDPADRRPRTHVAAAPTQRISGSVSRSIVSRTRNPCRAVRTASASASGSAGAEIEAFSRHHGMSRAATRHETRAHSVVRPPRAPGPGEPRPRSEAESVHVSDRRSPAGGSGARSTGCVPTAAPQWLSR